MARRHRLFIPGLCLHVIQRGNNRAEMFRALGDYQDFLRSLQRASVDSEVRIHGFALMKNHVHLIVTPERARAVALMMQSIGARYVMRFNQRYMRTGTLFEGRYRASVIDTEQYFLRCLRYVELNPLRAGLVTRPEAYRWSSYRTHAFGAPSPLLTSHPLYLQLGSTAGVRQEAWRAICTEAVSAEDLQRIREAVRRERALGEVRLCPAPTTDGTEAQDGVDGAGAKGSLTASGDGSA